MRKAKIIATLGPASDSVDTIIKLIKAGLNVARINMSHGTYQAHTKVIQNIRKASKECDTVVGILLDLQGPKIRVDKLPTPLELKKDEIWVIGPTKVIKDYPEFQGRFIPTIYEQLVDDATENCSILFDDGNLEAIGIQKIGKVLKIKIIVGGILKSNKGINLPDIDVSAPSFTLKDKEDLLFGLSQGIDYVALSFVRTAKDIVEVQSLMHQLKVERPIIAKIEKPQAITNINKIIEVCDGIMIARGDMGVEVGNHHVPLIQKKLIKACNEKGKFVITATQMLESMIDHARPTRAEASDVANAIWDGTDAIMLSGETASGNYPVETVMMMDKIVVQAESNQDFQLEKIVHDSFSGIVWSVQAAAALIAEKVMAKWIISFTQSGISVSKLSHYRPKTPVLAVCSSKENVSRMAIYWGVTPLYLEDDTSSLEEYEHKVIMHLLSRKMIENANKIVITHGDGKYFLPGRSDTVKVEIVRGPQSKNSHENIKEADWENGRILHDTNICASCQVCVNVCPFGIWQVSQVSKEEGNTVLHVDNANQCTLDLECVENCPTGAIEIYSKNI